MTESERRRGANDDLRRLLRRLLIRNGSTLESELAEMGDQDAAKFALELFDIHNPLAPYAAPALAPQRRRRRRPAQSQAAPGESSRLEE